MKSNLELEIKKTFLPVKIALKLESFSIYLPIFRTLIVPEHFNNEKAICFFDAKTTFLDYSFHPCKLISSVNPVQNEITSRDVVALALLKISTFTVLGILEG